MLATRASAPWEAAAAVLLHTSQGEGFFVPLRRATRSAETLQHRKTQQAPAALKRSLAETGGSTKEAPRQRPRCQSKALPDRTWFGRPRREALFAGEELFAPPLSGKRQALPRPRLRTPSLQPGILLTERPLARMRARNGPLPQSRPFAGQFPSGSLGGDRREKEFSGEARRRRFEVSTRMPLSWKSLTLPLGEVPLGSVEKKSPRVPCRRQRSLLLRQGAKRTHTRIPCFLQSHHLLRPPL